LIKLSQLTTQSSAETKGAAMPPWNPSQGLLVLDLEGSIEIIFSQCFTLNYNIRVFFFFPILIN